MRKLVGAPEPVPPRVLGDICREFARYYPAATVGEWVAFSEKHARASWEDGFRLGWESRANGMPEQPVDDPAPQRALEGELLGRTVLVQAPDGYEHVAFVDERGVRYE